MSQLHKFLFDGLPVRGMLVQITTEWQEVLARRAANADTGAYPAPVRRLLGEMTAAAVLMQSNIKFNGALVMQVLGDGPVKLAVVEVQPDLSFRATAKVMGEVSESATLTDMVNAQGQGRCAVTLDPKDKLPGQQPYQGVVPLNDAQGAPLAQWSQVLMQYMLQSEQLDTTLVLAANDDRATGLWIQRLPVTGEANLAAQSVASEEDRIGQNEDYNRIATLGASLKAEEILLLDADTVLHRLFWEEKLLRFEPLETQFACSCSQERVAQMIRTLGHDEAQSILQERSDIDVGCDFCGKHYRFDAVDVAQLFHTEPQSPGSTSLQ